MKVLSFLQKKVAYRLLPAFAVAALIAIIFSRHDMVSSLCVGGLFSMLILRHLCLSQTRVLLQKKPAWAFLSFLQRLGLYSIPIIIALKWPLYFNLWVILICLFSFQIVYIAIELAWRLKRQRRKDTHHYHE